MSVKVASDELDNFSLQLYYSLICETVSKIISIPHPMSAFPSSRFKAALDVPIKEKAQSERRGENETIFSFIPK